MFYKNSNGGQNPAFTWSREHLRSIPADLIVSYKRCSFPSEAKANSSCEGLVRRGAKQRIVLQPRSDEKDLQCRTCKAGSRRREINDPILHGPAAL